MRILRTALLIVLVAGCATSPTGRSQIMLVPDSQMNAMGSQSFQQMKGRTPVESDPATNRYVQCVAMAVAREAQEQTSVSDWEVVVFRDKTANAFALPGGKIGVHTGILLVAKTPGQLGAVLGHEVGHVIARHGNERVSQGLVTQGGLGALDAIVANHPQHGTMMALLGLGAQYGVLLPYSRTQESEADKIGLDLMARAGFDPHESVELWKNMSAAGGGQPPQFLSTHPSHETRIAALQAGIPDAMAAYEKARASGRNPGCAR